MHQFFKLFRLLEHPFHLYLQYRQAGTLTTQRQTVERDLQGSRDLFMILCVLNILQLYFQLNQAFFVVFSPMEAKSSNHLVLLTKSVMALTLGRLSLDLVANQLVNFPF